MSWFRETVANTFLPRKLQEGRVLIYQRSSIVGLYVSWGSNLINKLLQAVTCLVILFALCWEHTGKGAICHNICPSRPSNGLKLCWHPVKVPFLLKVFAFEAYGISSVLAEHRVDSCPEALLGGSLHEELSLVNAGAHHICHLFWGYHRVASSNDNFVHTSLFV